MSPRTRFTETQIANVLKIYSTVSTNAAYAVGKSYGMTPSRVRQFAFKRGVKARMGDGTRWKPIRDVDNDPRWARAIAMGPVIA